MSLLTYEAARPWARSIRNEVRARVMPPWPADPAFGRFSNDRRLSGRRRGDHRRVGGRRRAARGRHLHRRRPSPMAGCSANPTSSSRWRRTTWCRPGGPTSTSRSRCRSATCRTTSGSGRSEVRGNPSVVHHNVVYSVDADGNRDTTGRLASFTPGKQYDLFNEPAGKLVKKGSTLVFSVHYHPNGVETRDRSKVGLFLATQSDQLPDPLARGRRSAARDPARRSQLRERRRVHVPHRRRDHALQAAHALARQGHEVRPALSRRPRRDAAVGAEVRHELAGVLRAGRAQGGAEGLGAEGDRALRQLAVESAQPRFRP